MAKPLKRDLPGCHELECEKFEFVENPVAKRHRRKPKAHHRVHKKKKSKLYF